MNVPAPPDPNDPPARDPRDTGILSRRTPADRGARFVATCPVCQQERVMDNYTIVVGTWFGARIPGGRMSAKGKLGTRGRFYTCTTCSGLFPTDDVAREWSRRQGDEIGLVPKRSQAD